MLVRPHPTTPTPTKSCQASAKALATVEGFDSATLAMNSGVRRFFKARCLPIVRAFSFFLGFVPGFASPLQLPLQAFHLSGRSCPGPPIGAPRPPLRWQANVEGVFECLQREFDLFKLICVGIEILVDEADEVAQARADSTWHGAQQPNQERTAAEKVGDLEKILSRTLQMVTIV